MRVDTDKLIAETDILKVVGHFLKLTRAGNEWQALCPFHNEHTPSFAVVPKKRIYKCMGCGKGGDVIDFVQSYKRVSFREAVQMIAEIEQIDPFEGDHASATAKAPKKPEWTPIIAAKPPQSFAHYKHGEPSKVWAYQGASGEEFLTFAVRFDLPDGTKDVLPYTLCTNGNRTEWRWQGPTAPKPLYGLNRLAANPDAAVILVEGEKTADALQAVLSHVVVITWMGGANGINVADWTPLHGRKVIIWPDNDWQGLSAAIQIIHTLTNHCTLLKIVRNPADAPKGWDFADAGWSTEETRAYVNSNLTPPPPPEPAPEWAEACEAHWLVRNPDGTPGRHLFLRDGRFFGQRVPEPEPMPEPEPPIEELPFDSDVPDMPDDDAPMHRNDAPFIILGYEKVDLGKVAYVIFDKVKRVILRKSAGELTKSTMLELADLSFWEQYFPTSGKEKFDEAAAKNFIIRNASQRLFSIKRVRGRGAWMDHSRTVIHAGDRLIVNGHEMALGTLDTSYIYEISDPMRISMANPLSADEARRIHDLVVKLPWEREVNATLLAGWCVIAPICGALKWRPHIWLTGGAGTGKSWIMKNIVRELLGESALQVQGDTTEAGLRQTLGMDAMPVVFDEAEPHDPEANRRIQSVLSLMRSASTSDSGEIIKGTAGHNAKSFRISSCFAMASISVAVDKKSDRSRVTILGLNTNHKLTLEELNALYTSIVTPEYVQRLQARTLNLLPIIIANANMFSQVAAEVLGEQRLGDQLGPMLAGAYSLFSENRVNYNAAKQWILKQDWVEEREIDQAGDEVALLQFIYNQQIRINSFGQYFDMTITELIEIAANRTFVDGISSNTAYDNLRRYGIIAEHDSITISNTHQWVKNALRGTPWATNHNKILKRLPGATATGPLRFAGQSQARGIRIPTNI